MTRLFFTVALVFVSSAIYGETEKAQPKEGKPFGDALSQHVPESISSLPQFGSIEWEITHMPWVTEGPYEGISGTATVALDGKIYVAGGFLPGGDDSGDRYSSRTSKSCWCYDPASGDWIQMADAPIRRDYIRGAAAHGKFYIAGGGAVSYGPDRVTRDVGEPYAAFADVAVLDPNDGLNGTWTLIEPLNVPRTHMAVGFADNKLIFAGGNEYQRRWGGYSTRSIRGTTEVYDFSDPEAGWQVTSPIPGLGRGWSASAALHDKFYVFGGVTWVTDNDVTAPTSDTLCYDPATDTWTFLNPPPIPVSGWEGAIYDDRYMLLVGGVQRRMPGAKHRVYWSDLVLAYDVEEDAWLQVDGVLEPGAVFNDSGVAVIGDTIYVVGGEGTGGSHYDYFLIGTISKK